MIDFLLIKASAKEAVFLNYRSDIAYNMCRIIFLLNLFPSLIHLGVQQEINEINRITNVPINQVIPSELLKNLLRYNEKSATVKSNVCDKNKNKQFRVSNLEEQKWKVLLNKKTTKPIESSNNIKLDYSQLQKLTFVNNSNNRNINESSEMNEFQTVSKILLQDLKKESKIELQEENFEFLKENEFEKQQNKSDTKKEKVNDENLLPISRKSQHTQTHLDNNADAVNEQMLVIQSPEYDPTRKSTTEETTKGYIKKSIINNVYIVNNEDDDDISFSSESNESNVSDKGFDSEKTELISNNDQEVNESVSIEYNDNNDLNTIKKHLELRNGMKMTDASDSFIRLMASHRICYACVSSTDPSCLKPNRQTTVKYCHSDNTACVTKSYTIGRSSYIIRDCGSSCISSDINGLAINYETCSICHSDLCNSAYSINIFIAPLIISVLINKIIY